MLEIPSIVKQQLLKLVPSSLASNTSCFAFYDHHPCDRRTIDVTVCTGNGELKELYQREIVSSIALNMTLKPTEVTTHRNSKSDLFYIILACDELFVVHYHCKNKSLQILHKLSNVERYSFDDFGCKGEPYLHVLSKDDAVPIVFDEDFKLYTEKILNLSVSAEKRVVPLETNMSIKCTLARYNTDLTEKSLVDMKKFRQLAGYMLYQSIHPNLSTSLFNQGLKEMAGALSIRTERPWVKTCNQKVVMVINICNENIEALEEIEVLLHGYKDTAMTYTTKLFQSLEHPPYWKEVKFQRIVLKASLALTVVVDIHEMKGLGAGKINFDGVIMYKMRGKVKLLPLEKLSISAMDTMGEKYDVFSNAELDKNAMLAVLATSVRTDLVLNQMPSSEHSGEDISRLLCTHLLMEEVTEDSSLVVHRKSPYHALNGVMVLLDYSGWSTKAAVYSRNTNQVLSLIYYIHDAVPSQIVVTAPNHQIDTTSSQNSSHKQIFLKEEPKQCDANLMAYGSCLLSQTSTLLAYFDKCMMRMNESRNERVICKIGSEIDVFACGVNDFVRLKEQLDEEMMKGTLNLCSDIDDRLDSESMIVDSIE